MLQGQPPQACPVLAWAASGAMWLTGPAGGPPAAPEAPVLATLDRAVGAIRDIAIRAGHDLHETAAVLLTERASSRGLRRQGQRSLGGQCRLLEASDGWAAVNLARPEDAELVPATVGRPVNGDPWEALASLAGCTSAAAFVARAQLLGIPSAVLPSVPPRAAEPFRARAVGRQADRPARSPLVVNLSALWAGPLCAHLLAQCGARVVQVEDPRRPDGARVGDPWLFSHLHAGSQDAEVDFSTPGGRARLRELVEAADIVIESSRPRALRHAGLHPGAWLRAHPGRTWVSITGYGRTGPWAERVAFGDDAAVAGGLVAWSDGRPVFCADAIADPVAGVYAALGALRSWERGGGTLVDVAMRRASAFVASGPTCPEDHPVSPAGDDRWVVHHGHLAQEVLRPAPVRGDGGPAG